MVYFDLTFEYILFGCFCVSLPLYIYLLINLALVRKSDTVLGSSFFRIVLSTGVADVLTAIQTYTYFKFRFWNVAFDFYATIHPIFKYDLIFGFATTFAQSFGNLMLCINRYTAMTMPLRHAVIWSSERVRFYILAQWIIALIIVIPGAFLGLCDVAFNRVSENGTAIVDGINYAAVVNTPVFATRSTTLSTDVGIFYQALTIIVWGIGASLTIFIYGSLFFAIHMQRKNQENQGTLRRDSNTIVSQEYRLLAYGIISTLIQIATATLQFLMVLDGFNKWYRVQAAAVDAANYSHPYFLLILSTALRQRMFPCGTRVQAKSTAVTPYGHQSNSRVANRSAINRDQMTND